jgi:hypothetical protein
MRPESSGPGVPDRDGAVPPCVGDRRAAPGGRVPGTLAVHFPFGATRLFPHMWGNSDTSDTHGYANGR